MAENVPLREILDGNFIERMEDFFAELSARINLSDISEEYRNQRQELEKIESYFLEVSPDTETAETKINEYSDICAKLEGIGLNVFYRKGFADGVKFILRLMSF